MPICNVSCLTKMLSVLFFLLAGISLTKQTIWPSSNVFSAGKLSSKDTAIVPQHPYCMNNYSNVENKLEIAGEILKKHVQALRRTANRKVELVFLVDSSASVGAEKFANELKFVRKLLSDFTVDRHTTRVSVITFSSTSRIVRNIDHLSHPSDDKHKCSLYEEELPKIEYTGGGTYTLGAVLEAKVSVVNYLHRLFLLNLSEARIIVELYN